MLFVHKMKPKVFDKMVIPNISVVPSVLPSYYHCFIDWEIANICLQDNCYYL